jgi:hypothetical protein
VTIFGSSSRSSSNSAPSAPKTARRMAFSVIRMVEGITGNGWPVGHDAISRTVSSSTIRSIAARRRPWNGGTSSLRWARCSSPFNANIEPGPRIRPRFGSMFSAMSGLVWNSCLISAGSLITSDLPKTGALIMKESPNRSRSLRIPRWGWAIAKTVCTNRGVVGPGGSLMSPHFAELAERTSNTAWYATVPSHGTPMYHRAQPG